MLNHSAFTDIYSGVKCSSLYVISVPASQISEAVECEAGARIPSFPKPSRHCYPIRLSKSQYLQNATSATLSKVNRSHPLRFRLNTDRDWNDLVGGNDWNENGTFTFGPNRLRDCPEWILVILWRYHGQIAIVELKERTILRHRIEEIWNKNRIWKDISLLCQI